MSPVQLLNNLNLDLQVNIVPVPPSVVEELFEWDEPYEALDVSYYIATGNHRTVFIRQYVRPGSGQSIKYYANLVIPRGPVFYLVHPEQQLCSLRDILSYTEGALETWIKEVTGE